MARIRSVHPDICLSEPMARLSASLERTFVRLWTHCDDYGRCVDNSLLIKAAIYPLHEDVTADKLDDELDDLKDAGLIFRYVVAGRRLIQVRSWDEYQHPNRPKPSKLAPVPVVSLQMHAASVLEQDVCTPGEGEATERAMHALTLIANARTPLQRRAATK